MCLYLLQVDELQISIEDEQKSIAYELRAIAEEQKTSIEEGSGGASDVMACTSAPYCFWAILNPNKLVGCVI
jgi:hypothetical protein